MNSVEGFILVGGASSRMGKDKSRLKLGRLTLVEVIAGAISQVAGSAILVGRNADDLGLNSTTDVYEQWGALGGLHAALANCKADWAIITACDLPFVSVDLFRRMASFREGFDAVAPVQDDGYPQPLCALYRVNPCLERSESLIKAGERRPIALLNSVRTRWVAFEELRDLDGAEHFFDNINTPEDYVRATTKGGSLPAKG
jgi:molybdenum cofactor guanylyltransferase